MAKGMNIKVESGRDNSSGKVSGPMGKKLGGSTTNVGHSISGASAPNSATGK